MPGAPSLHCASLNKTSEMDLSDALVILRSAKREATGGRHRAGLTSRDVMPLRVRNSSSGDGFGASISEGVGRGSHPDHKRFVRTARGSLNETKHWLRRAYKRKLLTKAQVEALKPVVDELAPRLNAYLNSIGRFPADE